MYISFPIDNKTAVLRPSISEQFPIMKPGNMSLIQSPGGVIAVEEQKPRPDDLTLWPCSVQSWELWFTAHTPRQGELIWKE